MVPKTYVAGAWGSVGKHVVVPGKRTSHIKLPRLLKLLLLLLQLLSTAVTAAAAGGAAGGGRGAAAAAASADG
jgi:hypothetical protein